MDEFIINFMDVVYSTYLIGFRIYLIPSIYPGIMKTFIGDEKIRYRNNHS